MAKINYIKIAKKSASIQITELKKINKVFDKSFIKAVDAISKCKGKLVTAGIGKSGLIANNDVSHFRLSIHLSLALFLLSLIFWYLLEIFNICKFKYKLSNFLLFFILILIILQIVLGSFLSGLDGGLIYNSWPSMNGTFFPNDATLEDYLSSELFYNTSIIQFFHRIIAYILLFFIIILNYQFIKKKLDIVNLLLFDFAILLQVFLGIITLVSGVEIKYALLHQLGSIFVLTSYILILFKNSNQQL